MSRCSASAVVLACVLTLLLRCGTLVAPTTMSTRTPLPSLFITAQATLPCCLGDSFLGGGVGWVWRLLVVMSLRSVDQALSKYIGGVARAGSYASGPGKQHGET